MILTNVGLRFFSHRSCCIKSFWIRLSHHNRTNDLSLWKISHIHCILFRFPIPTILQHLSQSHRVVLSFSLFCEKFAFSLKMMILWTFWIQSQIKSSLTETIQKFFRFNLSLVVTDGAYNTLLSSISSNTQRTHHSGECAWYFWLIVSWISSTSTGKVHLIFTVGMRLALGQCIEQWEPLYF